MHASRSKVAASLIGVVLCTTVSAQVTKLVSVSSGGTQGDELSNQPTISANRRFVAFASDATNLVAGDTNGFQDVFVRDRLSGTTERVSLDSSELQANHHCFGPSISADGRYVVFSSFATNLVPADTNGQYDVFLRDRQLGTTERVSVDSGGIEGNSSSAVGQNHSGSISADGRYVVFASVASNLVPGDTNGQGDAFLRDRQLATTERVSVDSGEAEVNGGSGDASVSDDGRYVAFESGATNLVAGDTNGVSDIFVRDRQLGTTERVSVDSSEVGATSACYFAWISDDGRYVSFESTASLLVPGDTNGSSDVFLRDLQSGTTERVSLNSSGVQGNFTSNGGPVSADGRYVTFSSLASNLVPGDTNSFEDVFVRDRQSGTTERVSVGLDGAQGNDMTLGRPQISADGLDVVFTSRATNLVPGDSNARFDVFVRERGALTENESVGVGGVPGNGNSFGPSISADDRFVAFESNATNLVASDTNGAKDIFVRDRQAATTILVSVDTAETPANASCSNPSISADGRYVAFDSVATNLVAGDTNTAADVFLRDLQLGTTTRVSVDTTGVQGNAGSTNPSISGNGNVVGFESAATTLVAGDTNAAVDVFVRDLLLISTTRASVDSVGAQGNGNSANASLSVDGRYVAFDSDATNLVGGDTNLAVDVLVRDRQVGTTQRVSADSGGTQGAGSSSDPDISADGRFVAFESDASNLVSGDTNLTVDVFVRDRQVGTTQRVSADSGGTQGAGSSSNPTISAGGRFVAFESDASNLVSGDTNLSVDVFVRDRQIGTTQRVSADSGGTQGAGSSSDPSITADGRNIAFHSSAPNLVPGDTNGFLDVFVRDEGSASAFETFCFGDGTGTPCPCSNSGIAGHGCENSGGTGGSLLIAGGDASLSDDTVRLTASGEKPTALSIFLQGSASVGPLNYGDGLRCAGGALKRLRVENAVGGVVVYPSGAETPITARSAALGDPIPLGATRNLQVYYRDSVAGFCPAGGTFNVSNAIAIAWGP